MSITIKELTARDRYALNALLRGVTGRPVDDRSPHAAAFLADASTFAFGAYLADVPVGWAWGYTQRRPDGRVATYVHEVDVVGDARGNGAASMLLRAVLTRAKRAGHDHVWLVADVADAAANDLYGSLGAARASSGGDVVWEWRL